MIEETVCNMSKFLIAQRFEDIWFLLSHEYRAQYNKEEFISEWKHTYESIVEDTKPSQFKIVCKILNITIANDNHRIVRFQEITKIKFPIVPIWIRVPHGAVNSFKGCVIHERDGWFFDVEENCGLSEKNRGGE